MDENEKELLNAKLRGLEAGIMLQSDLILKRAAQIAGLDLVVKSLVQTHPNPAAFKAKLHQAREVFLASAIPSDWSDDHIQAARNYPDQYLDD